MPDADWTPGDAGGTGPGVAEPARAVRPAAGRKRLPGAGAGADRPQGHLVRHSRHPHDQPAAPRVDLPHGVRGGPAHHRLRSAEGARGGGLVRARRTPARAVPIGVAGYGEGGLLALYSAALDTRIDATLVSGYFQPREELWKEPIYRDVWGLLREFGDAEIAGHDRAARADRGSQPRARRSPDRRRPPRNARGATPNGTLTTPPLDAVRAEVERARPSFASAERGRQSAAGGERRSPGLERAASRARDALAAANSRRPGPRREPAPGFDPAARLHRQFDQLVAHTQTLVRQSPRRASSSGRRPTRPRRSAGQETHAVLCATTSGTK